MSTNCLSLIGRRLITPKTIQAVTSHIGYPGCYGATWRINQTLNGASIWLGLPADANADAFVLFRAPRGSLTDYGSYEFYAGLDEGEPKWSAGFSKRAPILSCPGRARRASVSYNQGIGRYLLWQQHQFSPCQEDTRFIGGFGVYDAPEPWGPWRNVYFTDCWDIGPGDLACFPTKWMSEDGLTMWLVFAGNDMFSLRRATLVLNDRKQQRIEGALQSQNGKCKAQARIK